MAGMGWRAAANLKPTVRVLSTNQWLNRKESRALVKLIGMKAPSKVQIEQMRRLMAIAARAGQLPTSELKVAAK